VTNRTERPSDGSLLLEWRKRRLVLGYLLNTKVFAVLVNGWKGATRLQSGYEHVTSRDFLLGSLSCFTSHRNTDLPHQTAGCSKWPPTAH